MATNSRAVLRRELGNRLREPFFRRFGDSATVDSGTTTSLIDATLDKFADDDFNGGFVYISATTDGAAPQDEETEITDFNGTSGQLTLDPPLSAAPEANDTYEIWMRYTPSEIHKAINAAIRAAWPFWFEEGIDESIIIQEDVRSYTLPSGVRYVLAVYLEQADIHVNSTATSGGANTLTDTDQSWDTDEWNSGYTVTIYDGTGKGQSRDIIDTTTDTITVATNWTTQPDSTSKYIIKDVENEKRPWTPLYNYKIQWDSTTGYIKFQHQHTEGMALRLHYIAEPDTLSADSDTSDLPLDYIILRARAELYAMQLDDAPREQYNILLTKIADAKAEAMDYIQRHGKSIPPSHVTYEDEHFGLPDRTYPTDYPF